MDAINIGLIILGILATIIVLFGILLGIALIIAAPVIGKIFGIVIVMGMITIIIGLWIMILN